MNPIEYWRGKDGDEYTERNKAFSIASNIAFFSEATKRLQPIATILEFGCNVGLNLAALKQIFPDVGLKGVDINESALKVIGKCLPGVKPVYDNICTYTGSQADLVLTKGVLIHIHPRDLKFAYQTLYDSSKRYILIAEYYSPRPVMIPYRGQKDLLWKRDFAGELMDKYQDLKLIDYGFWYHRDKHVQDDINYFLMEKGEY